MDINKISFESFRQEIIECFKLRDDLDKFQLVPDKISEAFKNSDKKLKWEKIDNWEPFDWGFEDISYEEFIKIIFKGSCIKKGSLYIVTDECFLDKEAYCIDYIHLEKFIKVEYFNIYKMDFFQPHDIIFFKPNEKFFSMLHHSGFVAYYGKKIKHNKV
ncbi:MAG: hypothetical protein Q8900_13230 [Bacillota bacterium]|nr:hypothetical protein [Bacillota bacterium]